MVRSRGIWHPTHKGKEAGAENVNAVEAKLVTSKLDCEHPFGKAPLCRKCALTEDFRILPLAFRCLPGSSPVKPLSAIFFVSSCPCLD